MTSYVDSRWFTRWLFVGVLATAPTALGQSLTGDCSVADPPDVATIGDDQVTEPLSAGFPVDSGQRIETRLDNRVALYLMDGVPDPTAEVAVYLDSRTALRIDESGRRLHIDRGNVVVHYQARDGAPLILVTRQGWARMDAGTLHTNADPQTETTIFTSVTGTVTIAAGAAPDALPDRIEGGVQLASTGDNQGAIAANAIATRSNPSAADDARQLIDILHTARLDAARAGWLRRAISGDIVPSVESPAQVSSALSDLTVESAVVQRTGGTVTTPVVTTGVATQAVPSLTQRLLTGGNAASVLVGVRLERTRIVGSPGTQGGGTVQFNSDVRLPFQLSTRR